MRKWQKAKAAEEIGPRDFIGWYWKVRWGDVIDVCASVLSQTEPKKTARGRK